MWTINQILTTVRTNTHGKVVGWKGVDPDFKNENPGDASKVQGTKL